MSLDVYLNLEGAIVERPVGIFIRENGAMAQISREEWDRRYPGREPVTLSEDVGPPDRQVFWRNITHNLGQMAMQCGLYAVLWQPETLGISTAAALIEPLRTGLQLLEAEPEHYRQWNPTNGWGDYEGLVSFVRSYLAACERYPAATVEVDR
jgi:hypothetical protein